MFDDVDFAEHRCDTDAIFVGCGPSQSDLIARAARRTRPKDDEDDVPKPPPPPKATAVAIKSAPPPSAATPAVTADPGGTRAESGCIGSDTERKPEKPLSEGQRRAMSVANLTKVAEAMRVHAEKYKGFPPRVSKSGSGITTLSWRVELLPYLGYEELYKKFNKNVPWNREPNKSLLQYIPDCYVSPERFDTNTNLVVPANAKFLFGTQDKMRRFHQVEDGLDNTVMLLEVNDSLAVPWTAPSDFHPKDPYKMRSTLGGLRKDGTFAAWANGWTFLLSKSLSDQELFKRNDL